VPLILFPEGCAYRHNAISALRDHKRPWHVSFVSPSFECLKSAAVEGMGITVLALALVTPPLRVVRHGLRLPQLPTVELAYSFGRRSNSRVVGELANYLVDSLANAGTSRLPRKAS
jgi:DNA-binding transcriptional LysR family regulator